MQEFQENNLLIICPNEEKMKILDSLSNEKQLFDLKFMTKEEYKRNYYFAYTDKTLYYLLNKYNYNLDVAKVYLENLYVIDENTTYKNSKLNFLKDLKLELQENDLLDYNPLFKSYIEKKKIVVKNYYDLDKYEEDMLKTKVSPSKPTITTKVVECQTLEEEVNHVCLEILKLLDKGISLSKIFLGNVSSDYYYTLNKLFKYYNIPLNLDMKYSIYGTKVVKDYLQDKTLDLEAKDKAPINRKLLNIIASLSSLDKTTPAYKKILIDKLKNTYLPHPKKKNAVSLTNIYNQTFSSDEYVFVLGFNQDSLPTMEKDISFITDALKDEVPLYKTSYLNARKKEVVAEILSNIPNLYLSYKNKSPFASFYPSSLIADLQLEVVGPTEDLLNKSNAYNELRLAEMLDAYNLYGEKTPTLHKLFTHYNIPYNTYSNAYTGINNDTYLLNLPYPLKLSYTSLNAYNECNFKYYITKVLKLDKYEDTFQAFIGSLYHKILELYARTNFDFEKEYQKYLETRELNLKERLLLVRIKADLKILLDTLKEQQLLTGYDDALYEKKVEIPLDKSVSVIFTGTIDKIMYYKKVEDTYFSIVDYKSGTIDTHIEPMKYGLHMQLPVYLYLLHYSRVFTNPIFTGIYYQNILFNYPTWDAKKDPLTIYKDNLKLQGYSTTETDILARFDSTYEESSYIKSMSYGEKGFGRYAKTIDNDTLFNLVTYTKKHISDKTDAILNSSFAINPKVYDGENISCKFCKFQDLCYKKESDQVYLDKVTDLSFLGGEE